MTEEIRRNVMATWVTHLMVADQVFNKIRGLDRHGFCVGNIAPDCNVENILIVSQCNYNQGS